MMKNLKLRDGSAVTYHKNGRIKETGKYSKGKKNEHGKSLTAGEIIES